MSEGKESTQTNYDYVVLGGGSGGIASARRAAAAGAKVLVIEKARWGGTCVNVGCVPKKVMFNVATTAETIDTAHHFGFTVPEGTSFDWLKVKKARDAYITRLNSIYETNLRKAGVDFVVGQAKFVNKNTIEVNGQQYTGKYILVAVGGFPKIPDLPGKEHIISSDTFFELEKQPKKVAVVGAGYIAAELAGIFNALGTETYVFTRKPEGLLRNYDHQVTEVLMTEMQKAGCNLFLGSSITAIKKEDDDTFTVTLDGIHTCRPGKATKSAKDAGEPQFVHPRPHADAEENKDYSADSEFIRGGFDCVLYAIGRAPNTRTLNLEAAGIEAEKSGAIKVDKYHLTTNPQVYAIGDVIGKLDLTPVAIAAGRLLADYLFKNKKDTVDYSNVPTVMFTHPPIGVVGLSEAEAKEQYGEDAVKSYTAKFPALKYGIWDVEREEKHFTFMKVVVEGEEERVVGIHLIGEGSDEMLQGFGVALRMGATKADLDRCVAIHPTSAEEVVTMGTWGTAPGFVHSKAEN